MTSTATAVEPVRRRLRRAVAALLALTGLVLLAGCMKVEMNMTLSEDDTVSGSVVMAISNQAAETFGMDPAELADQMTGQMGEDLPAGATQEPYSDGEYTGSTFTFAETPIDEFSGSGTDELSVTREGDEYVVAGTMDLSEDAEDMEGAGDMPQEILDSFVMTISVTFPGEITETNGTVDGNTVTWEPTFGQVNEMNARGSATGSGGGLSSVVTGGTTSADGGVAPWLIILGVVLGLAVIGVVVWLVVRSNRRPAAQAATPDQAGYPQHDGFGSLPGQQQPPVQPGQLGQQPPGPDQGPPSVPPGQPPVDPYDPNPR